MSMMKLILLAHVVMMIVLLFSHLTAAEPLYNDLDRHSSKYAQRELLNAEDNIHKELFGTDVLANRNGTCDYDIHLMWSTQVGSSVFATPLITDLFSDGKKDIVVPTITHYAEALDGLTGHDVGQFPFLHPKLRSQTSVVPVDLDSNGINEYMISTYNGELVFIDEEGHGIVGKTIKLPPAAIDKTWFEKMSHHKETEGKDLHPMMKEAHNVMKKMVLERQPPPKKSNDKLHLGSNESLRAGGSVNAAPVAGHRQQQQPHSDLGALSNRRLLQEGVEDEIPEEAHDDLNAAYDDYYNRAYEMEMDDDDMEQQGEQPPVEIGTDGWLSPEAKASMDLVFHSHLYRSTLNVEPENDLFKPRNEAELKGLRPPEGSILVDAHILATPVVLDIDGDGGAEAIVAVSYFFDEDQYKNAENPPENMDKYVATGIVCFDLVKGKTQWSSILHITTKKATFPAYALSSPLVINVDQDMLLDVFIGTTQGLIAGFDSNGVTKKGWPVRMGPIMSAPIATDVNGDGNVDICAGDVRGNLVCFNAQGHELFDKQVAGSIVASPTAGDLDGNGVLDLVVGTTTGAVFAIETIHKNILPNFPVRTGGPVVTSALLVNLADKSQSKNKKSLDIVVPSNDGSVYIININGCYELIDLGEKSLGMVLADDLTGNGRLDLVISTMSGTVSVYETGTTFHPLKAWLSKPHSLNGMTAQENLLGIYLESESRVPHDVRGDSFILRFTIVDNRNGRYTNFVPRYVVYVMIGKRLVVSSSLFFHPGSHFIRVPTPMERVYTTVSVIMSTPNALRFEDSVSLSFNMHFLDAVKYVLIIPFLVWCAALSLVKEEHQVYYPDRFRV